MTLVRPGGATRTFFLFALAADGLSQIGDILATGHQASYAKVSNALRSDLVSILMAPSAQTSCHLNQRLRPDASHKQVQSCLSRFLDGENCASADQKHDSPMTGKMTQGDMKSK